jgi:hypothetical protein
MLYAGLDLSRKRLDFHLLDEAGATLEVGAAPPDAGRLAAPGRSHRSLRSTTRPPETCCSVANCLAAHAGSRRASTITPTPTWMRSVLATAAASTTMLSDRGRLA